MAFFLIHFWHAINYPMAALSEDSVLLSALPSLHLASGSMLPYNHELSNPISTDVTSLHIISSALLKPSFMHGITTNSLCALFNLTRPFFDIFSLSLVGSQDSLLEITFRAKPPSVLREPLTSSSSTGTLAAQSLLQISDSAWVSALPGPCSQGTTGTDTSPLGLGGSGVRLECFRFSSRGPDRQEQGQDTGETPSDGVPDESSVLGEQVLGALELLRFRESGIGSEYESNTDESDDRDSWGQGEGLGADGAARLFNVLNAESLSDCLGDEMAV